MVSARRVFVAIKASDELAQHVVAWQREHAELSVRWIAAKNLHVTLVPPWYEEDLEQVREQLRRLRKHGAFQIAFNIVEYGPDPKRPRLIWAAGQTTKEVLALQEHAESALGAHNEQRFRLHMTLARFRQEDFQDFPVKRLNGMVDWRMDVRSVVLMESKLSSTGADYEVLEEIGFDRNT